MSPHLKIALVKFITPPPQKKTNKPKTSYPSPHYERSSSLPPPPSFEQNGLPPHKKNMGTPTLGMVLEPSKNIYLMAQRSAQIPMIFRNYMLGGTYYMVILSPSLSINVRSIYMPLCFYRHLRGGYNVCTLQ